MKRFFANAMLLAIGILVGAAWLMVFPFARTGTTGDVTWAVVSCIWFLLLRLTSGVIYRVFLLLSVVSILAAIMTLLGPAQDWAFVQWSAQWPIWLQFDWPSTDAGLFLLCFFAILLLALALPWVRRALLPKVVRRNAFD